jgi:hypothetical protein
MAPAPRLRRGVTEQDAIGQVTARLTQQFPELSASEVARAVNGQYAAFEHSPIRDFVPVLVERASREQLQYGPANQHRA